MMNMLDKRESLWLIDRVGMIGIQKIDKIPDIPPLIQLGKICVAMGMTKIKFRNMVVCIRGIDIEGCCVTSEGYDIVPFLSGLQPTDDLVDTEIELVASKYKNVGYGDDDSYN